MKRVNSFVMVMKALDIRPLEKPDPKFGTFYSCIHRYVKVAKLFTWGVLKN